MTRALYRIFVSTVARERHCKPARNAPRTASPRQRCHVKLRTRRARTSAQHPFDVATDAQQHAAAASRASPWGREAHPARACIHLGRRDTSEQAGPIGSKEFLVIIVQKHRGTACERPRSGRGEVEWWSGGVVEWWSGGVWRRARARSAFGAAERGVEPPHFQKGHSRRCFTPPIDYCFSPLSAWSRVQR